MFSSRYGDLHDIARCTDERCHLCHEPAYLEFYGRPGAFGDDTVTIDHLFPQAFGGDDERTNLRLAHARCNSTRGTRDYEEVRLELAGTTRTPLSRGAKVGVSVACGGAAGYAAGHLFAKTDERGQKSFNGTAALLTGAGVALLLGAALF